jgi:uncharacterized protein (TIGR02145 family)
MKRIGLSLFILLILSTGFAQTVHQFKYQAVLRDADGNVLVNEAVSVEIALLEGSVNGVKVFEEIHTTETNFLGLINLNIGSLNDLSVIDWSSDIYFLQLSVNGTIMGTSQLLSVPYAIHSASAGTADYNNLTNLPLIPTDLSHLSDNMSLLFSGSYNDLYDLPVLFDGDWSSLTGTLPGISTFNNDAGYLTSYTESDPVFTAHTAYAITGTNISNWNTAYGWGDHSTEGYLTSYSETDPVFTAHTAYGITGTNTSQWNTAYGWGDHSTEGYITSYSETDPVFTAHTAYGITGTNTSQWNTAYGWGDHSTEGYLTSYSETDPVFTAHTANSITGTNISNWNNAYGWGDHSSQGYIKTEVDGSVTNELQNLSNVLSQGNDAGNNTITNLADPVNAKDAANKSYVDAILEQMSLKGVIVMDVDGNIYPVIRIGSQVWMAENLQTTHYSNGDPISDGTGIGDISTATEPKYWFAFDDDHNNVALHGRLYTGFVVTDSRNVCPDGWHVPHDDEWQTLIDYIAADGHSGLEGKVLKATSVWYDPFGTHTGTDLYGFTALPGGERRPAGGYIYLEEEGHWWTSRVSASTMGFTRGMHYNGDEVYDDLEQLRVAFSIRCVKD